MQTYELPNQLLQLLLHALPCIVLLRGQHGIACWTIAAAGALLPCTTAASGALVRAVTIGAAAPVSTHAAINDRVAAAAAALGD